MMYKKDIKIALFSFFLLFVLSITFIERAYAQIRRADRTYLSVKDLDDFLNRHIDSLKITGLSLAVINDGKIVYYRTHGVKEINSCEKVDTNTLFEAASMTKPVFAYTVMKLVEQGEIDLDYSLYKYWTYKDIEYDKRHKIVTARMVLGHTTGLPNWRPKEGKLEFKATPGNKYTYSGEGYEYLGYVVSHIKNEPLEETIERELFNPLGISSSYFRDNEYVRINAAVGHTNGETSGRKVLDKAWVSYGLRTEAREYSKFIIMLMKESLVPNSTFNKMATPQIAVENEVISCLGIRLSYTENGPKYFHSGNNGNRFQSYFEFYKDSQTGFVFFINCNKGKELTSALINFISVLQSI